MIDHTEITLPEVEFMVSDGIFIKQMLLATAGIYVPQHSHTYDHASMIASGSVRVWQDEKLMGDFKAPMPFEIKAGVKHTFLSLEDNTVVYCIHQTRNYEGVSIESEHNHVSDNILSQGV